MKRCVFAIALLVLPGFALAQQVSEERVALLTELLCENGGSGDDAWAERTLPGNGFTRSEVRDIANVLEDRGQMDRDGQIGLVTLSKGVCDS